MVRLTKCTAGPSILCVVCTGPLVSGAARPDTKRTLHSSFGWVSTQYIAHALVVLSRVRSVHVRDQLMIALTDCGVSVFRLDRELFRATVSGLGMVSLVSMQLRDGVSLRLQDSVCVSGQSMDTF